LECIFGFVDIAKDAAADSEDHRSMSLYQQREGRLFAAETEALQQVRVAHILDASGIGQLPQIFEDAV